MTVRVYCLDKPNEPDLFTKEQLASLPPQPVAPARIPYSPPPSPPPPLTNNIGRRYRFH